MTTRARLLAMKWVGVLLVVSVGPLVLSGCAAPASTPAPTKAPVAASPTQPPAAAATSSASTAAATAPAKAIVLKYAGPEAATHPFGEMQQYFAKRVTELSNGQVKVEVYPANQLGPQTSQVDQMVAGSLESMYGSLAYAARYAPKLNVITLPFALKSDEQAFKVMDGPFGQKMAKYVEENSALKILSYLKLGFRHPGNNKRPIQNLDDMKGLKIRVQPAPIFVKTFEAMGASPVSMDYAEVYTAIQTRVLDGAEFPLGTWLAAKYYEVVKDITLVGYTYDWMAQYVNKKFYDGLSPDLQKAVSQASQEAADWERKRWTGVENDAVADLQKQGVRIVKLPDAEWERFRQSTLNVDKEFDKDFGADLIRELRDLTAK